MSPTEAVMWRGAVQFRVDDTSSIYASWPFGVVTLTPESLHARIQPRWAEGLARVISSTGPGPVERHLPWDSIDAIEIRGRRALVRSESGGDLLIIAASGAHMIELAELAANRGIAQTEASGRPLSAPKRSS